VLHRAACPTGQRQTWHFMVACEARRRMPMFPLPVHLAHGPGGMLNIVHPASKAAWATSLSTPCTSPCSWAGTWTSAAGAAYNWLPYVIQDSAVECCPSALVAGRPGTARTPCHGIMTFHANSACACNVHSAWPSCTCVCTSYRYSHRHRLQNLVGIKGPSRDWARPNYRWR
jgi:hypothetical protein